MKKVIVLDSVIEQLKNLDEANLFGVQNNATTVISSLTEENGLVKVGIFSSKKGEKDLSHLRGSSVFWFSDGHIQCSYIGSNGEIKNIEPTVVNYRTDFQTRNCGIIDVSVLQKRTVTVIGLGSGGSIIASDLVRCGVTSLNLIDFDEVSVTNLCRSAYELCDVGRKKTDALLEQLLRINPCAKIKVFYENVLEMQESKLTDVIRSSDLVIEASDNPKTKILINGLAYHLVPVIYPAVYELGKGGDILFTTPGLPCYECVFKAILPQMKEVKRGDWDYSTGPKPMPALLADIKVVTSRTTKIALAILLGDQENSPLEQIAEPGCSMLFIGNEKFWIFKEAFQEVWAKTEFNPECSCQTLT